MVKKLKAMAEKKSAAGAGLFDSALASAVRESAKEIWLAGMGAFAKAQAEGRQVFETLVKEGSSLHRKTQGAAEERFNEVTNRMTSMANEVTARAGQHWDKLETIFEARTARALKKLGVPTAKDLQALSERIDALAAKVPGGGAKAGKTAARKRAPAKTAVKRAPRKTAA